jgi:RNA recognition motif-containing protein
LVIKRLPDGCTQDSIEEFLQARGLERACNFLYAPANFRKGKLFGYCFLNFVSPAAARRALQKLSAETTQHDAGVFGQIEVSLSLTHQGLDAQIDHYRNCPVMHPLVPDGYKPRLYVEGKIVSFPAPTEPVQLPRGFTKGSLQH